MAKPILPDCAPVECTFTIPASIEKAWRQGYRGELADCIAQIARDTATYVTRKYEQRMHAETVQ